MGPEQGRGGVLCVIPARYGSTRFPGKAIAPLLGRPMVWWVWQQAEAAKLVDQVVVATDDERVREVLAPLGVEVEMTSAEHQSGTDRVAEVAERRGEGFALVLNLQGDEPLLDYRVIDRFLEEIFAQEKTPPISTLAFPLHREEEELRDPNLVKVVVDGEGFALYFSRFPIPYPRNVRQASYLGHVGIYAFRPEVLAEFTRLEPCQLELAEGLEQLRALYHGIRIRVFTTSYRPFGVDTEDDLRRAEEMLRIKLEMQGGAESS